MAQLNQNLYETIARNFDQVKRAMTGAGGYIEDAVEAIVNITTTNYIPDGADPAVADANAAIAVELALLGVTNSSADALTDLISTNTPYLAANRAMNNFVINNYSGDETTANGKLTEYVNSVNWHGSLEDISGGEGTDEVPFYWAEISQDAGFNVDEWEVEQNPVTETYTLGASVV